MFEAEFVPDQLEFFPTIILASWVESYPSFVSFILLNYLGSSGESSSDWDLSFSINQLQDLFCSQHAPTPSEIFVALTFHS